MCGWRRRSCRGRSSSSRSGTRRCYSPIVSSFHPLCCPSCHLLCHPSAVAGADRSAAASRHAFCRPLPSAVSFIRCGRCWAASRHPSCHLLCDPSAVAGADRIAAAAGLGARHRSAVRSRQVGGAQGLCPAVRRGRPHSHPHRIHIRIHAQLLLAVPGRPRDRRICSSLRKPAN